MPGLRDAATVLAAWEAGMGAPPLLRGAAVLGVLDGGSWAQRPVGDVARAATAHLGARVSTVVTCSCGVALDVDLPLADAVGASVAVVELPGGVLRAPTPADLQAAAGRPDPREVLVDSCLSGQADPAVVEEAFEAVAGAAVPGVRAVCPDCGAQVEAVVDVGALLWQQVQAAAPIVLQEVADLAAAYGWTEAAVLSLPAARRRAYLDLARR